MVKQGLKPVMPRVSGRELERGQVQSLMRALALLNALAEADDGITLTDAAQQVGLPASTVHRLLTTLQQERYVQFDAERRLWSIGVQAFIAGNAFTKSRNLTSIARPAMRRLMEDSGETVNLAIEDQGQAVYLAQVECRQMMRAFARPGARVPLHCSGVGKALLSAMEPKALAKLLHKQGLPRMTLKTRNTAASLRDDLIQSQSRGFAIDDEEHAIGLRCIAAVIFDENRDPLAALSVSGPMARIEDERIPVLGTMVRQAAQAVSISLGGKISV